MNLFKVDARMEATENVCPWAANDPLCRLYHDTEWGIPQHDDRKLFELVVLEGMQAGLSWLTILRKRENFRRAFNGFDPYQVSTYDEIRVNALLQNAGIIRNQLKIRAAIAMHAHFLRSSVSFPALTDICGPLSMASQLSTGLRQWMKYRQEPRCLTVSAGTSSSAALSSQVPQFAMP